MDSPRIAIFNDWLPFHIGDEIKDPAVDDPFNWSTFTAAPRFEVMYDNGKERYYTLTDTRATDEIHRLIKFKTCPICRKAMTDTHVHGSQTLVVCLNCGFWGGRGKRFEHSAYNVAPRRAVFGIYRYLLPLKSQTTDFLVSHLRKHPDDLPKIGPKRAEKFVLDLLSDYLKCEVKPLGGTKDKGVDGFILKGDDISTVVQVKWRQDINKAESVNVVREVGGTLLARGVPAGILVSNRRHYSKDATEEAKVISERTVETMGQMELTLYDYHHLLDMLEISNTKLNGEMKVGDWFHATDEDNIFDGAMKLPESYVNMFID